MLETINMYCAQCSFIARYNNKTFTFRPFPNIPDNLQWLLGKQLTNDLGQSDKVLLMSNVVYQKSITCRYGQLKCRNGQCILEANVCNGRDDCSDFNEERHCFCTLSQKRCIIQAFVTACSK